MLQPAQRTVGSVPHRGLRLVEDLPDAVGVLGLAGDAEYSSPRQPARAACHRRPGPRDASAAAATSESAATLAHISRTRQAG